MTALLIAAATFVVSAGVAVLFGRALRRLDRRGQVVDVRHVRARAALRRLRERP